MNEPTSGRPATDLVAIDGHAASSDETLSKAAPGTAASTTALGLAAVALIAAVATLGGGYWLWRQIEIARVETDRALQASQLAMTERLGTFGRQFEERLADLSSAQQADAAKLNELDTRVGAAARDWVLFEAEYLMQLANHRTAMLGDVKTSLAALTAADERLARIGDPLLLDVRKMLAGEINALKSVELPDTTGMALALGSLAQGAVQLPLASRYHHKTSEATNATAPSHPEVQNWRDFLAAIWATFKGLITVRYNDRAIGPLLPPDQVQNLYENLALQFEVARIALLKGDTAVFYATLDTLNRWLDTYFDPKAQAVKNALETVQRLRQTTIDPTLPDITGSLRALRKVMPRLEARLPHAGGGRHEGRP